MSKPLRFELHRWRVVRRAGYRITFRIPTENPGGFVTGPTVYPRDRFESLGACGRNAKRRRSP
jgi:hypothetical protein